MPRKSRLGTGRYTVQTCFSDFTGLEPTPHNVLGILSLIIVVTVKYVIAVMRAERNVL